MQKDAAGSVSYLILIAAPPEIDDRHRHRHRHRFQLQSDSIFAVGRSTGEKKLAG